MGDANCEGEVKHTGKDVNKAAVPKHASSRGVPAGTGVSCGSPVAKIIVISKGMSIVALMFEVLE